jgi:hypothetical protein
MLSRRQIAVLIGLALVMWVGATGFIRLLPAALGDPRWALVSFTAMAPVGWASVRLIAAVAGLRGASLLAGVGVVGAIAMMIDGVALAWAPQLYAASERGARLGAAWLLWGYGLSLAIAVWLARLAPDDSQRLP